MIFKATVFGSVYCKYSNSNSGNSNNLREAIHVNPQPIIVGTEDIQVEKIVSLRVQPPNRRYDVNKPSLFYDNFYMTQEERSIIDSFNEEVKAYNKEIYWLLLGAMFLLMIVVAGIIIYFLSLDDFIFDVDYDTYGSEVMTWVIFGSYFLIAIIAGSYFIGLYFQKRWYIPRFSAFSKALLERAHYYINYKNTDFYMYKIKNLEQEERSSSNRESQDRLIDINSSDYLEDPAQVNDTSHTNSRRVDFNCVEIFIESLHKLNLC
eukprot:CAMPEP_0170520616 /NCGR_PEP_ID=MMETSP0209-20121228/5928_1 /TAXON_ID=665100 ORGANISM="Litonotus pictus, Strain P1" /NCGR_SAMPLE_ID=MMETSP0209 /ASSEMBLY_ACC=CAM_ASM_000301 /LENGTH=262 /DNA_ID=CAMNT_0010807043 /DNA_START=344 /DNA_END=1132 /DNA_ORIENTATION=-